MAIDQRPGADERLNNFGFLRLLFAALVIVSHSPELVDGNRSREILTQLFHTMSFGEVAVDGFFLISGYLITKSFVSSSSTMSYLVKRVLRIVPGYLVSFLLCVLVLAPFVGGTLALKPAEIRVLILQALTLYPPTVPGAFAGLHYPVLNGAMWTIAYEFRCYIAILVLGWLGLFRPRLRLVVVLLTAVLLVLNATHTLHGVTVRHAMLLGDPENNVRFGGIFGTGAVYYLFRDKIPLTHLGAVVAAALLGVLMFNRHLAETAFALLAGYLILWCAFKLPVLRLSRFDNRADISYGLYLYGWPVQTLIVWNDPSINPVILCGMSLLGAGVLGWISWTLVEKPCLQLAHRGFTRRMFASS